jgi:hypothetical protein
MLFSALSHPICHFTLGIYERSKIMGSVFVSSTAAPGLALQKPEHRMDQFLEQHLAWGEVFF